MDKTSKLLTPAQIRVLNEAPAHPKHRRFYEASNPKVAERLVEMQMLEKRTDGDGKNTYRRTSQGTVAVREQTA